MRIVIAEDEALLREGLVLVLRGSGHTIAATTSDARHIPAMVDDHKPDLLITDIRMPPNRTEDGLRAAIAMRTRRHPKRVLVLSQYVHRRYAEELLGDDPAGVGYLLKQRVANVASFCRDVRTVAEGGTVLDPDVVAVMLNRARHDSDALDRLTARQMRVLALLAEGLTNAAVARRLGITEKAVVHHVSKIYEALRLPLTGDDHRRVLAVVRYLSRAGDD